MNRDTDRQSSVVLGLRCTVGGTLMGLANLVPGISGGTMLLAAGIYPRFIESVADVSTFRFSKRAVFVLAIVAGSALVAILLGAGLIKETVIDHRWAMYSIFIGLTLGGVPVLWTIARPVTAEFWRGTVGGFFVMVMLALAQSSDVMGAAAREGWLIMMIAGIAGASAMILPGISGGYLLLVLGVYLPILGAIDDFRDALRSADMGAAMGPFLEVLLPVAFGVGIGVLVVSNALKAVLKKYEQPTYGVLMGFLVGAVVGLWPFQRGVAPKVGEMFRGVKVTPEILAELSPEKYPTELYTPTTGEVGTAFAFILAGFAVTALIARFGSNDE